MLDFLVSLLEANINFQTIGAFLIAYFGAIWILFCLWVFIDARRRFESNFKAIIFFLLVLILNFPALIFYLIIRPEKNEDHFLYLQNNEVMGESEKKGIDIPIVNFVGENGEVNLTFQLRVNKAIGVNTLNNPELNILSNPSNQSEVLQVNVGLPNVATSEIPAAEKDGKQYEVKKESRFNFYGVKTTFSTNLGKIKSKLKKLPSIKTVKVSTQSTTTNQVSLENSAVDKSQNSILKRNIKEKKKSKHRRR